MTDETHRFFKRVPAQSRKSVFERYELMIKFHEERIEWFNEIERKHPEESKARKQAGKIQDRTKKDYEKWLRKATR